MLGSVTFYPHGLQILSRFRIPFEIRTLTSWDVFSIRTIRQPKNIATTKQLQGRLKIRTQKSERHPNKCTERFKVRYWDGSILKRLEP